MTTWIRRIRVSGGFLKDLDVEFSQGLNVVIGARGTGKSTLLRLVRFALGVESASDEREQQDAIVAHMLGAGEISLDIQTPSGTRLITVNARGEGRLNEFTSSALALGQNEIEDIASSADERRQLLDLRASLSSRPTQASTDLVDITKRIFALKQQLAELHDRIFGREQLAADLSLAEAEEAVLTAKASQSLAANREFVSSYDHRLTQISAAIAQALESAAQIENLVRLVDDLIVGTAQVKTTNLPSEIAQTVYTAVTSGKGAASHTRTTLLSALRELAQAVEELRAEQSSNLAVVAPVRAELDASAAGLGEVTSRLRNLRGQLRDMEATSDRIREFELEIQALLDSRDAFLDSREREQYSKYLERQATASIISELAGDDILICVSHQSDTSEYRQVLELALRGSGIQYRSLIDRSAQKLLPREILEIAERQDGEALAAALAIPEDRATRFLAAFDSADALARLSVVQLADSVDFLLRDSGVDRPVQDLSTGQKSAVTLPILISDSDRTLILDQPEDHLDNEFLVDNIVSGLLRRTKAGAQSIIATHNPNIPVLGNAEQVVHLRSDGRSGHVSLNGPVDAPAVKIMITTLLEGGADAFKRRADFYGVKNG